MNAQGHSLRSLILPLYLPTFLLSAGVGAVLLALPLHALELSGSEGVAAAIFGMRGVGTLIADIPAGAAVSRWGDRRIMLAGTTGMALTALGMSTAGAPLMLGLWTWLFGAAVSGWFLSRVTYLTELVPNERRGRAVSWMAGMHRGGRVVGPLAAGFIGSRWGWPATFVATAAVSLSGAALIFAFVGQVHRPAQTRGMGGAVLYTLRAHKGPLVRAGMAVLALQVVRGGRDLLLPLWGHHIALDPVAIGVVTGASAALDMSLFYPVGLVMDRYGRKWTGVPCMVLMGLSMLSLPLSGNFVEMLAVGLLAGLGNGLGTGIVMTLGADLSPAEGRGDFMGVWRVIGDLGAAAAPFAVGAIAEALVLGSAALLTGGVGVVGALLLALLVPETLSRSPREPQHHKLPG